LKYLKSRCSSETACRIVIFGILGAMNKSPSNTPVIGIPRLIDLLFDRYAGWREDYLGLEQLPMSIDAKVALEQQVVDVGLSSSVMYDLTYAAQKLSALEQWNWQCISAAGEQWKPLEQSYLDFTKEHAVVIPFIKAASSDLCEAFIHRCAE
jgi:hypothetical protein